jgi:hypothetical protein
MALTSHVVVIAVLLVAALLAAAVIPLGMSEGGF